QILERPSRRRAGRGTVRGVNEALRKLLADHDGVVPWSAACAAVSSHAVRYASKAGHVRPVFPGVLTEPGVLDSQARFRAALLCAGPDSALSHLSALQLWGLNP